MKALKIILIVVVTIILIPLVVALFTKKDYLVEQEVVIHKPNEIVFDYIKYLKNQDEYSKWASMDPQMKVYFRGEDGTIGFVSGWESEDKNVGKGEQEITGITEGSRIDYELRFIEPFQSTSLAYMTTEPLAESSTRVMWGFEGRMAYPMNLMLLIMDFEKMISDDLEHGLDNLKTILEQHQEEDFKKEETEE
jgi:hypothetical protein